MLNWLNEHLEKALATILLASIVVLIAVNVFMRYVLNASLSWGEELTLWLFVWFVWIGISYAFHTGDHVRITILRDTVAPRVQILIDAFVGLLVLLFLGILTVECIKLINQPFVASQTSVVLQLPIPIFYASAPVGAALAAFRVVQHLARTVRKISELN
ncbi:TRAP transporter small permease subunit [Rhodobacterales bacterium FZCC0069]|nr:TRAP transporter small permease subunit [Rhodobacterales bacterium FZCC0069]